MLSVFMGSLAIVGKRAALVGRLYLRKRGNDKDVTSTLAGTRESLL